MPTQPTERALTAPDGAPRGGAAHRGSAALVLVTMGSPTLTPDEEWPSHLCGEDLKAAYPYVPDPAHAFVAHLGDCEDEDHSNVRAAFAAVFREGVEVMAHPAISRLVRFAGSPSIPGTISPHTCVKSVRRTARRSQPRRGPGDDPRGHYRRRGEQGQPGARGPDLTNPAPLARTAPPGVREPRRAAL